MNKSTIKEIKSIYSGRIKSSSPTAVTTDIKAIQKTIRSRKQSFFNGVLDKLNIAVVKD